MRYYLDTEFNGFGGDLISLALVPEREGERFFYAILPCADPVPWVAENVVPILRACPWWEDVADAAALSERLGEFLGHRTHEIVADWPEDIAYLCRALLTGPGMIVGGRVPPLLFEMVSVDAYPTTLPGAVRHNAFWDAAALRWAMTVDEQAHAARETRKRMLALGMGAL
jgi:hypothetical protein